MEIAIMGAGLSGLACAIQLEKHGITPTILERRSRVGDRFINGEILLSIFSRPVRDDIAFLADRYQIYLHPTANISEFIVRSAHEKAKLTGPFGFSNIRGRHDNSFESQLAKQVKTKIEFHSEYTYEKLVKEFTHVIVATGDAGYAEAVQNYQTDLTVTLKGATVEGDFSRYQVMCWLDDRFAPKGYGYLIPLSEKEANITIGFPDQEEGSLDNLKEKWSRFYEQVCADLDQNLKITDEFEINRYVIGQCSMPRIGNSFFTGNCFGSVMPLFGFGQLPAILTGIYAADDLAGGKAYVEATEPLRQSYHRSMTLRKAFESMGDSAKDIMVRSLSGRLGEKLLTTKVDVLHLGARLLRPFVKQ